MHAKHCSQTVVVLMVFTAAPCLRMFAKGRDSSVTDEYVRKARRRGSLLMATMVGMIGLQMYLGVCGQSAPWAEAAQMVGDFAVLAMATDSLWW